MMEAWVSTSSAAVASSRMTTSGRCTSRRTKPIRCCSPPERSLSQRSSSSRRGIRWCEAAPVERGFQFLGRGFAGGDRDSAAPGAACRSGCRRAAAGRRRGRLRAAGTRPEPQGQSPAMARISVLLPVPLSPVSRTLSPWAIAVLGLVDHDAAVVLRDREALEPDGVVRAGADDDALVSAGADGGGRAWPNAAHRPVTRRAEASHSAMRG